MFRADMPDELLRKAWQQRRRRNWPDTYEATMARPLLAALVRLQAGLLQRRAERVGSGPEQPAKVRRAPAFAPRRRPPPELFDRKRAAAGEREED